MKNIIEFINESFIKPDKERTDTITLREFITWYNGDEFDKITPDFLEEIGWDFMEDDVNMSLIQISKLFNDNLDNEFEFEQVDIKNCISISWEIDGNTFEVDSVDFYGEYKNR